MEHTINKNSKLLTLGILSMSFLMSVSNAVSGTIPLMEEHFSTVSQANIELLIVIPTAGVLLGTVISGIVSNILGKKMTVLFGLFISLVFGLVPTMFYSYFSVLISRALFGLGMGIFTPLTVSYITDVFPEEKRNKLLGWRNSAGAIGDAIMLFIAGFLINVSWQTTYFVFLFLLVPIIMIIFFVPKQLDNVAVVDGEVEIEEKIKTKPTTNRDVIKLAGLFLFICLFYSAISLKLPSLVVNSGIGSASQVTHIFSFLVLCSIISGLAFEKISKIFGKYTVTIFEIVTAISFILIPFVTSIPMLLILVLICGFSNGIINPALTARMVAYSPKDSMNFTTSIIIIGINIGFLCAPYIFQFLNSLFHMDSAGVVIMYSGVFYMILSLYDLFIIKKDNLKI
ncbi:hypothetical protein IGI39_001427 [Enterococcus sp. AZ135]|uniref:MFS transporter n=1 Tax=unclassified Enterococcus TaxID=2608891 RepID=UPI003F20F761